MKEAQRMKTAALCWLRFGKQMPYVATEVGSYYADVAGADLKRLYEIEVKTNVEDIKRDFARKTAKHNCYSGKTDFDPTGYNVGRHWESWIPNLFYYLVPDHLKHYALSYIEKQNPSYGIMVFGDLGRERKLADEITIVKQAKMLHERKPGQPAYVEFLKRMGSDLCHLHITRCEAAGLIDRIGELSRQCVEMRESVDDPA